LRDFRFMTCAFMRSSVEAPPKLARNLSGYEQWGGRGDARGAPTTEAARAQVRLREQSQRPHLTHRGLFEGPLFGKLAGASSDFSAREES
jgi:hypothetical protein